jgi:GPH family glycoside/pentoside/hexuronide:cation symporter
MTGNSAAVPSGGKLSRREIISYALPRFGSAAMFLAVGIYLPKFYTDVLFVGTAGTAFVGLTFLIGRFWDGFTDPVMGYISDHTKFKMGRRRPYFLISAVPVAIAYYFLWSPPEALKGWELFAYLTAVYIITYTLWTVFSIPHNSLGAELTMDYHERTMLTGIREQLGVLGTLVGTLAPPIFAAALGGERRGYPVVAGLTGFLTCIFIFICFFNVRENPEFQKQRPIALKQGLKILSRNRPFRTLVLVFMIALMGNAFVPTLTLYIADYVVKVGRAVYTGVIVSYLLMAALSIIFWTRLSRKTGKREAWSYALVLSCVIFALSTYYHEGTWVIWIILAAFAGFGYGATYAFGYSMMADVIDLDELETGRRREGAYFGVWFFLEKGAIGLTVFIGMQTLYFMGYTPNVEQSPHVWWALKFLYSILPAICFGACYFLLRRYPITQQEHERIRAEIEARKAAASSDSE